MLEDRNENKKTKKVKIDEGSLLQEVDYEKEIEKRQDSFLDSYSYYLKDATELSKNIVLRKAKELELVDPLFNFRIDMQ